MVFIHGEDSFLPTKVKRLPCKNTNDPQPGILLKLGVGKLATDVPSGTVWTKKINDLFLDALRNNHNFSYFPIALFPY